MKPSVLGLALSLAVLHPACSADAGSEGQNREPPGAPDPDAGADAAPAASSAPPAPWAPSEGGGSWSPASSPPAGAPTGQRVVHPR